MAVQHAIHLIPYLPVAGMFSGCSAKAGKFSLNSMQTSSALSAAELCEQAP